MEGESGVPMLDGLRVIDCGSWVAAPAAATVMGDFGAGVIKVEPPKGDPYRDGVRYVPGFPRCDENYAWQLTSRNKRSILLDLKCPDGQAVMRRLVSRADVLLTNYPPKVLEKLRLRWEDFQDLNPRLIYGQLSGYGESGPQANFPGFDRSGWWARSGLMDRMRVRDQPPAGGIVGWGDHGSAMTLFGAVMAALYRRERSGHGGKVSTSLLANGLWANALPLQARLSGSTVPLETPHSEVDNVLTIPYETRDRHWFYPWLFDEETGWRRFVLALGLTGTAADPRFASRPGRIEHAPDLIAAIEGRVRSCDWAQWRQTLAEAGIDLVSAATLDEVLEDPQVRHNGLLVPLETGSGRARRTVDSPLKIAGCVKRPAGPAPDAGQHTEAILRELDYGLEEIDALRRIGAVR